MKSRKAYHKAWRQANPDKVRIYSKNWRTRNPEKVKEGNAKRAIRRHELYRINREKILREAKFRYLNRREEVAIKGRIYREQNHKEISERKLKWHHTKYCSDEAYRVKKRLRFRLWSAFKAYSATGKANCSNEYGIDYNRIFEHLGPCPGDIKNYHIDHVRPLSSFNFNDPQQVKEAFAPENHQWLLAVENIRKQDKW